MTTADDAGVDHRLLEYGSAEEFAANVVPFLFGGLELGEPALVVASARNIAAVQDSLGSDVGQRIRFADADSWGSGNVPARVLAVDWTMRKLLDTARRCRYVGEFTWRGDEQWRAWRRHEAVANLLHPATQFSMLCTADTRTTPPEFLKDLHQTHPVIAPDQPNPDFVEPWTYLTNLDNNNYRPAPPHAGTITAVDDADLRSIRLRVSAEAQAAGLGRYQTQCIALAVTEVVTNVLHHAGTVATIRTWSQDAEFVCEVSDSGPGISDPLASYRPPTQAEGRCGLWLARTFCDELRILTSSTGTVVRMSLTRL